MATGSDKNGLTDYTGIQILALLLPVMIFFTLLGRDDIGRAVAVSLGAIMVAIKMRWDLRKSVWFWVIIVSVLLIHIPVFLLVHWPNGRVPPLVMLPLAFGDCLIVLGTVKVVEKYIVKTPASAESSDR